MNTDKIVANFNANISYIENSHPQLFRKLLALDDAVAEGYYKEQYELVFDNGYFDVLEKSTNNYLYTQNSDDYAKIAAKSIDYELKDNLFVGSYELQSFVSQRVQKSHTLKSIEKFIFFGVGLGLHIQTIHEKIAAEVYLIIENDLELFRLSLFTTNYQELAKEAQLFFCVFEEDSEFALTSELFLNTNYEYNKYIKYFHMLSHSEDKREQFHLAITNQSHLHFSYESLLTQTLAPLKYLHDNYQFLSKKMSFLESSFDKKPFLLLGAGPSLKKQSVWLKKNAFNFVIVAISATLSFLEKEKITPDIVIHLDAFENSIKHFDTLESLDFLQNSISLFSAKTHPIISMRLHKQNIFFFENGTDYKTDSFRPSSPCVGSIAYQMLIYFGVQKLFLLGLDLAVDAQTGATHSESHAFVKTIELEKEAYLHDNIDYKKHFIKMQGNLEKSVFVTPHFKSSIDAINLSTKSLKKEFQTITNFSNGAFFEGVKALSIENYHVENPLNKQELSKELYKLFLEHSSNDLTQDEQRNIESKLSYALSLRDVIKLHDNQETKSVIEYKIALQRLSNTLIAEKKSDINQIFELYLKNILPDIFDYLNRDDLEISLVDIKSADKLLVEQLLQIV